MLFLCIFEIRCFVTGKLSMRSARRNIYLILCMNKLRDNSEEVSEYNLLTMLVILRFGPITYRERDGPPFFLTNGEIDVDIKTSFLYVALSKPSLSAFKLFTLNQLRILLICEYYNYHFQYN